MLNVNANWFSKLKLGIKLQITSFLIAIALIIFLFFYIDIQSKSRFQNTQINEIQNVSSAASEYLKAVSGFLNEDSDSNALAGARKKFKENVGATAIEELNNIETNISKGEKLIERNKELFAEVEKLTEDSIATSNKFVNETSARLADSNQDQNVTTLERVALSRANNNSNSNDVSLLNEGAIMLTISVNL